MHALVISYHHPTDTAAFDEHYTATHVPLAARIPGLRGFTTGHCASMDGTRPAYYMVAELHFDSAADMTAGMSSPESAAAVADLAHFAGAGTTMWHHPLVDRI
ncbi:MAG: EthD family reductase [Mycobacteriaceae bacterium]